MYNFSRAWQSLVHKVVNRLHTEWGALCCAVRSERFVYKYRQILRTFVAATTDQLLKCGQSCIHCCFVEFKMCLETLTAFVLYAMIA
jgi:hypothetical protein